jgi:molecular chaperone HtpG
MEAQLPRCALIDYLGQLDSLYVGKLRELRSNVTGWLTYTVQTFPHYTRHTVEHSDEILRQLSLLLFQNGESSRPSTTLAAVEVYALCAAAYLHDAGMVISDSDKAKILTSSQWEAWTTTGGGARRWSEIQEFVKGREPKVEELRLFLANLQTRFLIAEFVRRVHHQRVKAILEEHQTHLANFAFGDPLLLSTIANICVAHGLRADELEDPETYPHRRTLRGESVNVRFIASLLRLGDLLDMSTQRACPMLLGAASPLPSDSLAHWDQYKRITHFMVAPDQIEITAECQTQEEHRLLQDWCSWLEAEARAVDLLMARAPLHHGWRSPRVSIVGANPTISIRRAKGATYSEHSWNFQLDADAVFERLVREVYPHRGSFIRELLQNALDATRVRLYLDLAEAGQPLPPSPTTVPDEWRRRYPIAVRVENATVINPLSSEREEQQWLTIEDQGIGMDADIVRRFLLQVGKSYYGTEDFRRQFAFTPSSRFGIGFLSVFAESEHVEIETFKPTSASGREPIALTITGPRNYLLISRCARVRAGTVVRVRLRVPYKRSDITSLLRHWCKRVEFPIHADDLGDSSTINTECASDFETSVPSGTDASAQLSIKVVPFERNGIEGMILLPVQTDNRGERWDAAYRLGENASTHPMARSLLLPESVICTGGIDTATPRSRDRNDELRLGLDSISARIDIRRSVDSVSLSRVPHLQPSEVVLDYIGEVYEELLESHLEVSPYPSGPTGWLYRLRLAEAYPIRRFWEACPKMLPVYLRGERVELSMREAFEGRLTFMVNAHGFDNLETKSQLTHLRKFEKCLLDRDESRTVSALVANSFRRRRVAAIEEEAGLFLAVTFDAPDNGLQVFDKGKYGVPYYLATLSEARGAYVEIRCSYAGALCHVLNRVHPFNAWLERVREASNENGGPIAKAFFQRAFAMYSTMLELGGSRKDMARFLQGWADIPGITPDLLPPLDALPR